MAIADIQARTQVIERYHDARDEASETVPGWNIEPTSAQRVLDNILTLAIRHDSVCQWFDNHLYRYYGIDGAGARDPDDAPLNDFQNATVDLCARLAPFALALVPSIPVYQRSIADHDDLYSINNDELRAFLLPLFEAAGIAERFTAKSRHENYPA